MVSIPEGLILAGPAALPVGERVRIVLAVLRGELTVAQAARQSRVSEQSVSN